MMAMYGFNHSRKRKRSTRAVVDNNTPVMKENETRITLDVYNKQQLKGMCKREKLRVGGAKYDLIARLLAFQKGSEGGADDTAEPKAKRRKRRMTVKQADLKITEFGLTPSRCGWCFRMGVAKGFIMLVGKSPDDVAFRHGCDECGEEMTATFRDLSSQNDYGGDYEDGSEGGGLSHSNEDEDEDEEDANDCCCHYYVNDMCRQPLAACSLDSGKFHNHAGPNDYPEHKQKKHPFGECIGDYRNSICGKCGNDYFCGLSGFGCPNCERGRGGGMGGRGGDCTEK